MDNSWQLTKFTDAFNMYEDYDNNVSVVLRCHKWMYNTINRTKDVNDVNE